MNRFILSEGKTQIEVSKAKDSEVYSISLIEVLGTEFNKKLGVNVINAGNKADVISLSKSSIQSLITNLQQAIDNDSNESIVFAFRIL